MSEFFAMGGFGVYIWPSWGLAFILLSGITASSICDLRRAKKKLAQLEDAQS